MEFGSSVYYSQGGLANFDPCDLHSLVSTSYFVGKTKFQNSRSLVEYWVGFARTEYLIGFSGRTRSVSFLCSRSLRSMFLLVTTAIVLCSFNFSDLSGGPCYGRSWSAFVPIRVRSLAKVTRSTTCNLNSIQ